MTEWRSNTRAKSSISRLSCGESSSVILAASDLDEWDLMSISDEAANSARVRELMGAPPVTRSKHSQALQVVRSAG